MSKRCLHGSWIRLQFDKSTSVNHLIGSMTDVYATMQNCTSASGKNLDAATARLLNTSPQSMMPRLLVSSSAGCLRLQERCCMGSKAADQIDGSNLPKPTPRVNHLSIGNAFARLPDSGTTGKVLKRTRMTASAIFL